MFLFLELHEKLIQYTTRIQIRRIAEAFLLAADAHETQVRSSGEPYITHPLAVSGVLADIHMDSETIMAALLHDVVEDTDYTLEQVSKKFGPVVAQLVDGVSKLTQMHFESKAHAQAENFRKMMLAMSRDIRVIIIKLADRLHNMRTLGSLRPDKRQRIAQETLDIYLPLAHRLGMNAFKAEFESLCFQALHPMRYRVLQKCVNNATGNRRKLMEKIQETLAERLAQEGVSANHIHGREKRLYSIYRKMQYRHLPFSEIMDVYGFRVIAKDERECYRLLGAVHGIFKPVPGRFKDYIAIPKANGYQSLHTTLFGPHGVPIEVQIRTREMDQIAEQGIAAHWLYKSEGYVSDTEVRTREWLTRLLDMQKRGSDSLEFIEDVKIDLFPDEVYVFTPKGDIMALPRGATALDFAYTVHTDVGNHCVSIKVNRRQVSLNQTLSSGQTVEVITDKAAAPDPGWLSIVISGKAKSAIRQYFKEGRQEQAMELGKKLLQYSLSEFDLSWDKLPAIAKTVLLSNIDLSSEKKLFEQIGQGERSGTLVAHQVLELTDKSGQKPKQQVPLTISGAEGVNMQFAHCCYPIPGDALQGVLQKGQGVEVHDAYCSVLKAMLPNLPAEVLVPLTWANTVKDLFRVKLDIDTENHPGILAAIAQVIAQDEANIEEISGSGNVRTMGHISVVLAVIDRGQLARIIRHIRQQRYVIHVTRVKNSTHSGRSHYHA